MKVWCSRDGDGYHLVWRKKPKIDSEGYWQEKTENILAEDIHTDTWIRYLFPKGIKPGECRAITVKRWGE